MKNYTVLSAIKHGTTKSTEDAPSGNVKDYKPGDMIELNDDHAETLLASGEISGPVEAPTKATGKAK